MKALGIDIGGTKTTFLVYDPTKNKVINKERYKTRGFKLRDYLKLIKEKAEDVEVIGISIPGFIKKEKLYNCPNNKELEGKNIIKEFKKLKKPFIIENDANSFVYAESKLGKGKKIRKGIIAGWIFGTGIGGGIALKENEKIRLIGNAEFGHQIIPFKNKRILLSKKAKNTFKKLKAFTLESIASGKTREELIDYGEVERDIKEAVAYAFYNISISFDVDLHIIGGGYGKFLGEKYFKEIEKKAKFLYKKETNSKAKFSIEMFSISEDSGALGAALIASNRLKL